MSDRRGQNDPLNRLRKNREDREKERGNTDSNTSNTESMTGGDTRFSDPDGGPRAWGDRGYATMKVDKENWRKSQIWLPPETAEKLEKLARMFGGSKSRALAYILDRFQIDE